MTSAKTSMCYFCTILLFVVLAGQCGAIIDSGFAEANLSVTTTGATESSNNGGWTGQVSSNGGSGSDASASLDGSQARIAAAAWADTPGQEFSSAATLVGAADVPAGATLSVTFAAQWDGGTGNGNAGATESINIEGPSYNETFPLLSHGTSLTETLPTAGDYTFTFTASFFALTFAPPFGPPGAQAESSGALSIDSFQIATPEPSSIVQFGLGALGLVMVARFRKRSKQNGF